MTAVAERLAERTEGLVRIPSESRNEAAILVFGREELPFAESALMPLFDRRSETREAALAIVMEPTGNELHLGCLGNLSATVTVKGEAAHTARPWLGRNAIHAAIEALARSWTRRRGTSTWTASRTARSCR